jgi:gamma-glutamylcyclotransferase (GGCT)/AIG2-like uncharacterized protein YtfP
MRELFNLMESVRQGFMNQIKQGDFKHRVAVYGTLKRGYSNHDAHLYGARFMGSTRLSGFILLDIGHFPAAYEFDKRCDIAVEIYEITDAMLRNCDRLEGVDSGHYTRITVSAGTLGDVFLYVYDKSRFNGKGVPPGTRWLPTGTWLQARSHMYFADWYGDDVEKEVLDKRDFRRNNPAIKDGRERVWDESKKVWMIKPDSQQNHRRIVVTRMIKSRQCGKF